MIELTTRWNQCSTDPDTGRLARQKAAELEMHARQVQDDSMPGLGWRLKEEEGEGSNTRACRERKRKQKQSLGKRVDNILAEFTEGRKKDKEKLREIEE